MKNKKKCLTLIFSVIAIMLLVTVIFVFLTIKENRLESIYGQDKELKANGTFLSNRNVVWFGDSLIKGYGETEGKAFPEYYAEMTGTTALNPSAEGSTINNSNTPNIINQVNALVNNEYVQDDIGNVDVFVLNGGLIDSLNYSIGVEVAQKEVGTVDMNIEGITPGDTISSNFEEIIYTLKTNYPDAKILYINTSNISREIVENIAYEYTITIISLDDFNAFFGTSATSFEEIKNKIIELLTTGNYEYGILPMIPNIESRYNEIQEQIKNAITKYDIEYLDLSSHIVADEDLQSDYVGLNANGYEKLTPYIIDKISQMLEYQLTEEELEVGKKGEVTSLEIVGRETGTGPFDDNNDPGNDENASNNVVRTFDQVTWTVSATMGMQQGASGENNLKGGVLNITAELPEDCIGKVEWDVDSMAWANGTGGISADGRTFTAKYVMEKDRENIPGQQSIILVAKVLGAENGFTFKPTFTMFIEGNEESRSKSVQETEDIIVSATPKDNITIVYHDEKYQTQIGEEQKTVMKFSLGFSLIGDNPSKGMKGVEIPKGDLTFDINYSLVRVDEDTQESTEISEYMGLYNYKYDDYSSSLLGNSENTISDFPSEFGYSTGMWPWSSNMRMTREKRRIVYQDGNFTMTDNGQGTIQVEFSDFDIGDVFPDRADYTTYTSDSDYGYEDNIGIVSVGMFYMEVDINEETNMEGTQLYFELEADNMKVNRANGDIQTEEAYTEDNIARSFIVTNGEGEYNKQIHYRDSKNDYLATTWNGGNGKTYPGDEDIYIHSVVEIDENNSIEDWIYGLDVLMKFDDKVIEVRRNDDGTECTSNEHMTFNILYAGKPDKTGWASDEEMNITTMDDLIYFDTIEELEEAGYVCVGALAESISGVMRSGFNASVKIPVRTKETAEINYVAQTLNDARIYKEVPDRKTQTHLLTNNKEDFPEINASMENLQYVKTAYDEYGQIVTGTHLGSIRRGDSVIVLGAIPGITISSTDSNNTSKTNFDLSNNENEVKYVIRPTITQVTSNPISGINLKIESMLPAGLTYIQGSSNLENVEVTINDETGETILTWYIYNCSTDQPIQTIEFLAHINEETANGTQYTATAFLSEVVGEDETSKLGNPASVYRTANTNIQVVNLSSYMLYKQTDTPVIEKDGEMNYRLVFRNSTNQNLNSFQLLDILPYNGDDRGTSFNGTYTVKSIEITGQEGLTIYTTKDVGIREKESIQDSGVSENYVWEETDGTEIGECTAFFVQGTVNALTTVTINIYLEPTGNEPGDLYINSATARTNPSSQQLIETTNVEIEVIKRGLEGYVWLDNNKNGIIDDTEEFLEGIELELLSTDNQKVLDINGTEVANVKTDNNGYYKFTNLQRGEYKVRIINDNHEMTAKNVGSNEEINSKFNENKETDIITELDSIDRGDLVARYINAGLISNEAQLTEETISKKSNITEIDDINDTVSYTIEYKVKVDQYDGNATVILEDTLPYAIDSGAEGTDLDGGIYDGDKTISWEIAIEDIDTYKSGEAVQITITKNIVVKYVNIDVTKNNMINQVTGKIKLETPEKESDGVGDTAETMQNFKIDVEVRKVWEDNNNEYKARPESITLILMGDGQKVDEHEINVAGGESSYIFTNVDKYNTNGKEITYTVDEEEIDYYNKSIDGTTVTNTYIGPILSYNKTAEIIKQTEEEITEGAVTAGDRIKYTITINNIGQSEITNVEIKDTVPEGTTIYVINDNGNISLNSKNEITWNIDQILASGEKQVSFEVTVEYDTEEKIIKNVGTVNGNQTNEVETPYEVPKSDLESSIVKQGLEKITNTDEKISYTINYKAEIREFVGKGKLKIIDYLPYEIDETNSELNGGTYNKVDKTITWEEDLGEINTYENANGTKEIERTKTLTLKYVYTDEENLSGTIENKAEGTITLTQEDMVVKEETKEDYHEVKVEIPAKVIVHHYIYDESKGGETKEQVPSRDGGKVADEEINGLVGQDYKTSPSNKIDENYECINATPDKYEGTMTKTEIEVTYYYKLKEVELGAIIDKTATASKQEEVEYETGEYDDQGQPITAIKTVQILTSENGVVTYNIQFRAGIKDYKGKATITIVDKLPASLDEEDTRIELDGGTYDSTKKTITWKEEIQVDTFATGAIYDQIFEKEIKVVYKDQRVTETLVNTAEGTITIYYPEEHSTNPGGERDTVTVTESAEVEQEYKVTKEVEKVWDDNNDTKGNRPNSVTVQLTANGSTYYNGEELEKVVLSDTNKWKHTFTNLPKYTEYGQEIKYSVVETETNVGDLEYYDSPVITEVDDKITVTNKYKLINTSLESSIEKTGTDKITSSKEEVTYNINYKATVTDYIGEAFVRIVDTLPYELAENADGKLADGIDLAGGTYDENTKTITWEERIEHINTYTNGDYEIDISKTIKVVYSNLDVTQRSMANSVKGTIDLYETQKSNTVEDTHSTTIEIPGKVIVKYVDKETGNEITDGYEINGMAGDKYTTTQKQIPGYTYVENTGNTTGNMKEGTIEVIYYYERTVSGGVHVTYVDENGNEIAEDETYGGKVGDTYKTEQKEIEGYEFVRVEGETEGELTEDVIEVVYVYKKIPAKVIVRYLEKDDTEDDSDNKVLYPEETINGYVGDSYITDRKEIKNYKSADPEPENKQGKMTKEDIYVTYYYEKIPSGKVIAQYVDINTKEEILYRDEETGEYKTYREETKGYIGDKYQTEQKDIPYYKIVEESIPANKEGEYTAEDIYVTYYYEKLTFNIGVEKNVAKIEINGKEQKVLNGKMNKVEVVARKIDNTEVKITYSIKVSNTGEIEGTAKLLENIPQNFNINEETGKEWTKNADGNLEANVELQAGETKELKVVLDWIKGENNFGTQKNTVEIVETENPASYEETTTEDNRSEAEVVMGISTGDITKTITLISAWTGIIIALIVFIYISNKYIKLHKGK